MPTRPAGQCFQMYTLGHIILSSYEFYFYEFTPIQNIVRKFENSSNREASTKLKRFCSLFYHNVLYNVCIYVIPEYLNGGIMPIAQGYIHKYHTASTKQF